MRKKLEALPESTLNKIGRDFSIHPRDGPVAPRLAEYFRSYNINWSDVCARYGLEAKK